MNLSGAFVLGLLTGAALSGDALRLLGTGLLGAYTTFSTWALESHRAAEDGRSRTALAQRRRQPGAGAARRLGGPRAGAGAVTHDALTLTAYFGERDAAGGGMLADALMAAYARRGLRASLLLRGSAGFGVKHHLRTDRLLTLSEDLPLVAMATDAPAAILAAAEETAQHAGDGLITLERASTAAVTAGPGEEAKLTVQLGRRDRAGGRFAHVALVDLLRRHGVAGATRPARRRRHRARAPAPRALRRRQPARAADRRSRSARRRRSPQRCPSSTSCSASRSARSSASASASATARRSPRRTRPPRPAGGRSSR